MNHLKKYIILILIAGCALMLPDIAAADGNTVDFKTVIGDTSFLKLKNVSKNQIINDNAAIAPYMEDPSDHYYTLQEVYTTYEPGNLQFRLGRQKFRTGTGYAWNPADLITRKSPLFPDSEMEGVDSAYLAYSFFEDSKISTIYAFGNDPYRPVEEEQPMDKGNCQVTVKTHAKVLDLAIHYAEARRNHTDYEHNNGAEATVPVKWRLLAAGVSGEIGKLGLHAEGGHAWLNREDYPGEQGLEESTEDPFSKDHSRFLIGMDYSFENELYLVLEYYQEGLGKKSPDEYTVNDRMAFNAGERETIGRDNVFLGAKYPIAGMASIELYNIINANDPSVLLNPWLTFSPNDMINVSLSAQIPVGKDETSVSKSESIAFGRIQLNF